MGRVRGGGRRRRQGGPRGVRGPRPGARGGEGGEEGEEEPVRLLQEEGRPHGICMQVWRYVLRDPPLQRQARLHVRLRCSRQVGDRRYQSRDCRRESRQNLRPTRTTRTTSVIISRDRTIPLLLSQE